MKILCIGSEGFIGKHLMEQGRAMGHVMEGCDIVGTPDWGTSADCLPVDALKHFDRVIHSAGVLGTTETIAQPACAIRDNIVGTVAVLKLCHEANVPFTYITLGNNWLNPYSITKNCAAEFVRMFNVVHGLPTQVAIAYNVFGPYQKWKPVRKIVPEFMTKILSGEPIQLTDGGRPLVDMVYAPDLARSVIQSSGVGTEHYGSGTPRSVMDVLQDCTRALGKEAKGYDSGSRPGETGPAAIAPYAFPNQTPYAEAMKITADWYRENFKPSNNPESPK